MLLPDHERFDVSCDSLCSGLRWKGQFILADHDPTVPPTNDGIFWCVYTQRVLGPDGDIVEPGKCKETSRTCHGSGVCR